MSERQDESVTALHDAIELQYSVRLMWAEINRILRDAS